MKHAATVSCGVPVKAGLKSGAIICYDNSSGFMVPILTPCSTPGPLPPSPNPPPTPGVQWLNCRSCRGARLSNGDLQDAVCEVCFM